jgi:dTDP-4-dehydrorhamnose reductase
LAGQVKNLLDDKKPFGVYHIINAGQASWFDFAAEIFRLKGKDVNLAPVSSGEFARKAVRPAKAVLVNTKLPQLRSWQEALKEFLNSKD